jgi:hypothetical protein
MQVNRAKEEVKSEAAKRFSRPAPEASKNARKKTPSPSATRAPNSPSPPAVEPSPTLSPTNNTTVSPPREIRTKTSCPPTPRAIRAAKRETKRIMLAIAEETPSTGRHQEDDAARNEVRGRQLSLLNAAEPPQCDAVSFTTEAMIHSEMPRVSEDIRLPALLTKNPKETLGADLDMISVVETEPVPHERENWNLPTPDEDPEQPTAETPTTTGRRLSTNSLTRSGTLPDLTSLIPEEPRQTTTTLTEFLIGIIRLGRSLGTEGDREIIHLAEAGLKLSDRELLQYVEEWIKRVIPKGSRRGKGKGMGAPAKNYGQKTTGRGPRAAAFKKAQDLFSKKRRSP